MVGVQVMEIGKQRVGGQVMWWRADMKGGYKKEIIPERRNGSAVARGTREGSCRWAVSSWQFEAWCMNCRVVCLWSELAVSETES